jgi:hypothetical protein
MIGFLKLFLLTTFQYQLLASELRPIALEWEAVEEASSYELEITSIDGAVKKFKSKVPSFATQLKPGVYKIRMRTLDERQVPGEWGAQSDFAVALKEVRKQPLAGAQVLAARDEQGLVRFAWDPMEHVKSYKLYLRRGDKQEAFVVESQQFEKELPLGDDFQWSLAPLFFDGSESEVREFWPFQVWGPALQAPTIQAPPNAFVKTVTWALPKDADASDVELSLLDPVTGVWRSFVEFEKTKAKQLEILDYYPGGTYRLSVRALGKLRKTSEASQVIFQLSKGDRSPASQRVQEMRESLQKKSPYVFQASWLYSDLRYQSNNYEYLSRSQFSAQGGSGRLGAGYLSVDGNWGAVYFADLSGFNIGADNYRFFAQELHVIYRYWRDTAMVRWSFGYYQKQVPELISTATVNSYRVQTIGFNGPHLGVDYWQPLTQRLGYKLQARLYDLSIDTTTPNGKNLVSRFSYNLGVLGSLRLSEQWVGFLGYTHKVDQVAYQADVNATGFASAGDVNDVQMSGNFLNLMLEWNF